LPTMNSKGVLENMWKVAFEQEGDYDAIVSHSYDWLSYYLSPFFEVPVLHAVALAPTIKYTDKIIKQRYKKFSKQFAFFSKNQAYFFGIKNLKNLQILYGGVVLENFKFNLKPQNRLVWSARISPEKGLLDAFAVADKLNLPLDICGKMQDKKYFNSVLKKFPKVKYFYHNFVRYNKLSKILGNALAFLSPHSWVETFGDSLIEAMACGTPVVAYKKGGPIEIIENGKSGFLVEPDNVDAMAKAVLKIKCLKRINARKRAEQFSYEKFVSRVENWISYALK
jgi:UDP-glucose:tetrahydrobiopterin glucosyltransferase